MDFIHFYFIQLHKNTKQKKNNSKTIQKQKEKKIKNAMN